MHLFQLYSFVGKNLNRIINKLSSYYNRLHFFLCGIHYGRHLCVHGHCGIEMSKTSYMSIGNNFYCSCGRHLNPLSRNLQTNICVNKGAELIIGDNVCMSSPVLWAHKRIVIGNNVMFGANIVVMDSDAHSLNYLERRSIVSDMRNKQDAQIVIEDDVFIGVNSIVLKGVTIGARSIIGAGSVVTKSIPQDCIACGNPAKIIKNVRVK